MITTFVLMMSLKIVSLPNKKLAETSAGTTVTRVMDNDTLTACYVAERAGNVAIFCVRP